MIAIENLTVRFGGVVALDGLTLSIGDDVVGLIGPNGAGKTTLNNAFSGFVPIASGSIAIDGTNLLAMSPRARALWGLARSFQKAQIVPDLTVRDHLSAVLDARRVVRSSASAQIETVLDFVGIGDCEDKSGSDLNPFERRMTEIAKCLVGAPRVILLDEPGGGLAETEMHHLRHIVSGIRARFGAQIILVDHDVDLIRDLCTSTAVLDFGRLIAFGPTHDVLQDEVVKTAYLGR